MADSTKLMTATTKARRYGQTPLTASDHGRICDYYGWRKDQGSYIDGGEVFVGSNYAGRYDGTTITLDR